MELIGDHVHETENRFCICSGKNNYPVRDMKKIQKRYEKVEEKAKTDTEMVFWKLVISVSNDEDYEDEKEINKFLRSFGP